MPFAGLGLHWLLAGLCAVHAVRSGQPLHWMFVLFAFPLLGSLVHGLVVCLPHSRVERRALKAMSAAAAAMDPGRAVREARAAHDDAPTAQNQMRLAAALLAAGEAKEAAHHCENVLQGLFAADPDLRYGAAKALVHSPQPTQAWVHLERRQHDHPGHRPESVALLLARAHAGASGPAQARAAFEQAVERHGSFEALAEYATWALTIGDRTTAAQRQVRMDPITRRWDAMNRALNEPVLRRLQAAQALAKAS